MRKLVILSVVGITVLLLFGCDNDPTPGGIYDVMLIDSQMNQCYGGFDTCSWTFSVSFKDNPDYDSHYYWAALERLNGPGEAIGKPRRLCNEGDVMEASVTGYYFDSIGFYALLVYRCDSAADVGNAKKATRSGELKDIHPHISEGGSQCAACCCTKNRGRYKAYAIKDLGNAVGASASIETRYGQLCGDVTTGAQSGAAVGIQADISSAVQNTAFVQMGYLKKRWAETFVDSHVYLEFRGLVAETTYYWIHATDVENFQGQVVQVPNEWFFHQYQVMVDTTNGVLQFFYDSVNIFNQAAPFWTNRSVTYAVWQGEIDGRESDMPGTAGNPCAISYCEYSLSDGNPPHPAAFTSSDSIDVTDRSDEWGIWFDPGGADLLIWDEFPLTRERHPAASEEQYSSPERR